MKRKHMYAILAAVALGLLLYAPTLVREPDGEGAAPEGTGLGLEAIDTETVARVSLRSPEGDSVRLERGPEGWRADGRPADSARVAELLAALDTARATTLVARNPANHGRLGVSAETGRRVEAATASGETVSLLVGTRDPGTGGYHVRREGEDGVWLLPGPLGEQATRDRDAWRDRLVARLDTALVREVVVRRDGDRTALAREEDAWRLVEGGPADTAAVGRLLRRLAELRATGFPEDSGAAAADFSEPEAVLSVFGAAADDVTGRTLLLSLRFLRGEEFRPWLLKRADDPEVFELSEWMVEELLPAAEELAGQEAAGG